MIGKEIRQTIKLAAPIILTQLAQMSMTFVDTIMVGRLGQQELAGVAVGGAVFFPLVIMTLGILMGVSPMVSQAYGARDHLSAGRAVRQGLWLGTLLAIPSCLVMWNGATLLSWAGQEKEIVLLGKEYLHAILWGVLPLLWFGVLRHFIEALSRPRVVMIITLGGVLLNIGANYVLMYGKLGFPALGLAGCGWASTLVMWTMFLVMAAFIRKDQALGLYGIFSRLSRPDWHYFSQLFRLGWPIGVMQGLEVGLFSTTALLMGLFSTVVLAAHQMTLQCAAFAFMIPLGLSLAVSVRVGQAVGREDLQGARRAGYVGIGLGASFMMITAICFWSFPRFFISLFLDVDSPVNREVVLQAIALLSVAAVFQVSDGIQVTAAGALRGLKDTRAPMIVALVSYWVVGLSSGYLFGFQLDMEGVGLWWGLVLGLTTAAILLWWRFYRKSNSLILLPSDSILSE